MLKLGIDNKKLNAWAPLVAAQYDYYSLKWQPQGIDKTNNKKNKSIGHIIDAYKSITIVGHISMVKTIGWVGTLKW